MEWLLLVNFLENVFSIPFEIIRKPDVYIGNTYRYKEMQRQLMLTKATDICSLKFIIRQFKVMSLLVIDFRSHKCRTFSLIYLYLTIVKVVKALHFCFYKHLGLGPSPESCLYFQDFQGSKLLSSCLVVWPNKHFSFVFPRFFG